MYFEECKKNLMALLRQYGCPTAFLTLSCAEYEWPELLQEIAETVYRRKFSKEELEKMTDREKKKLISDNVVISTMHFHKRFQKLFSLMKYDFFESSDTAYHVSSFFFRVEFQQRGSAHVHSLIWLKDRDKKDAPNFWNNDESTKE